MKDLTRVGKRHSAAGESAGLEGKESQAMADKGVRGKNHGEVL